MKLESATCALCDGTDSDLVYTVPSLRLRAQNLSFDLRRCRQCGLVRLSPRPGREEMAALYQPQFYTAPRRGLVSRLEALILRERVSFVRTRIHGRQVLDVGCGNGSFVGSMAAAGYDVQGLEPYQATSGGVPADIRPRIRCESLEAVNYAKESFDLITLWHILEHLERPVEALRRIHGFLKADGSLILEVPDFNSREARQLGPHWYNLDAPYHFWHFTPSTLEAIVRKAGFEVTSCVTSAVTRPVWLLNYVLLGANATAQKWQTQNSAWLKWPQTANALGLVSCLGNRVLFAGSCPMMRLVCRKSV